MANQKTRPIKPVRTLKLQAAEGLLTPTDQGLHSLRQALTAVAGGDNTCAIQLLKHVAANEVEK